MLLQCICLSKLFVGDQQLLMVFEMGSSGLQMTLFLRLVFSIVKWMLQYIFRSSNTNNDDERLDVGMEKHAINYNLGVSMENASYSVHCTYIGVIPHHSHTNNVVSMCIPYSQCMRIRGGQNLDNHQSSLSFIPQFSSSQMKNASPTTIFSFTSLRKVHLDLKMNFFIKV